jgi:restriction system protein
MGKRRADIWDDFFEALRWLFTLVHPAWSVLIAGLFLFLPWAWVRYRIPEMQVLGWVIGFIPAMVSLAAGVAGWKMRQHRATFLQQHLDIDWLNRLSWQDFERQVAEVYRQEGYQVGEVGGGRADGGVDLRLRRCGLTSIVRCKRWRTFKVGVKPVRELFGVMTAEKADRAVFITSRVYTNEALQFAQGKPIDLVDGAQLAQMLRRFQQALKQMLEPSVVSAGVAPTPAIAAEIPARPKCPRCGGDMVLRRAKRGAHAGQEFWGCSLYTKTGCGGIREIE